MAGMGGLGKSKDESAIAKASKKTREAIGGAAKAVGGAAKAVGKKFKGRQVGDDFTGPLTKEQQIAQQQDIKIERARRRQERGARAAAVSAAVNSGGSVINRIAPFESSFQGIATRVQGRRT